LHYETFDKEADLAVVVTSPQGSFSRRVCTVDGVNFFSDVSFAGLPDNGLVTSPTRVKPISAEEFDRIVYARTTKSDLKIPSLTPESMVKYCANRWESYGDKGIIGTFSSFAYGRTQIADIIDLRFNEQHYTDKSTYKFGNHWVNRYFIDSVTKTFDYSNGLIERISISTKFKTKLTQ